METYKRETGTVVLRFLSKQIAFDECIYSLDAALVRFVERMKPQHVDELRFVMRANSMVVADEMARRGRREACIDAFEALAGR